MKTLTCRVVKTIRGNIVTGTDWPVALTGSLKPFIERKQKIFILADNNTAELCLPILLSRIPELAGCRSLSDQAR